MKHFIKFNLIGLLNSGLGYLIIFGSMYAFRVSPVVANLLGYSVGLFTSYFLNRHWNFRSRNQLRHEVPRFLAVFVVSYLLNLFVLRVSLTAFHLNPYLAQIVAGTFYVAVSFVLFKLVVFRQQAVKGEQA